MSLVLAIEPDSSQVDPLSSVVRAKLGAELQLVTSAYAAIVAMNQRVPDVVLLGRGVSQDQRTRIVTHLRSLITDGGQVRTLDIPQFTSAAPQEKSGLQNLFRKKDAPGAETDEFGKKIGVCLAAAEEARVRAMASVLGRPPDAEWGAVALDESPAPIVNVSVATPAPRFDDVSRTDEFDVQSADLTLIEAEVEFRLHGERERLQAEAAKQQAREVARVEAEGAERRTREIARVEADAAQQRATELAKIETEAASQRESAVAEARAAADAAAREALATELERVRREAEDQLAAEIRRVRDEADQKLATQLDLAQAQAERDREERLAQARAEADAMRAAALEEARQVVEDAAARAKDAEAEVARVRAEADAQLKAAVARAREESEAQLQAQVARAQAETEARLEAQLASVIGEAEQVRHAHRQATFDADTIRMEAAEAARAAAETALAAETERIRAEANQRLEAEIARLRIEAARAEAQRIEDARFAESAGDPGIVSVVSQRFRLPFQVVRWDIVATAAVILVVVVAGVMYLPRAVSSAARTSSAFVGTAGNAAKQAAKQAVAAAPVVTRRAINAAERAMPKTEVAKAAGAPGASQAEAEAEPAADTGPGFITAFSRIPMDVYADGRRIGTTEDGQLLIKSGSHQIEFVSERFRYRSTTNVTIRPGHVLPYTVTLPSVAVHLTTTPGAEVWLEGERIGVAPLPPFQVPIGTRDIAVKDPSGREKRQSFELKYGETVEVSLMPETGVVEGSPATPRLAPLMRN